MIDLIILIACNIANLILGLSIFLRNPQKLINKIFAFLSFSIIFWTSLNFLSDNTAPELVLLFSRLTFVGGVLIIFSVLCLSRYFPNEKVLKNALIDKMQLGFAVVISLISLSPWIVESATAGSFGAELVVGSLYGIYILYVIQAVITLMYNFRIQAKKSTSALQRNQIRLMLIGLLLYAFFAVGTNLILPLLVDNWTSSRFGPLFSLFLVGVTGYTIVRHRLFDVRFAVARSIAYILSLGIFAAFYGIVVFGFARLVFNVELPLIAQMVLSAATGVAALSFARLKHIFDRFTNQLFYRDAYDAQDFFNSFNKALVSSADLNTLLGSASEIVVRYLKAEYCFIDIKDVNKRHHLKGTKQSHLSNSTINLIRQAATNLSQVIVITDELTSEHEELKQILLNNNVAMLVRLSTNYSKPQDDIGYTLLGSKKSGNPYNGEDMKVMEAASDELIVAVQNALRFEEIRDFNRTLQMKVDTATSQLRQTNTELRRLDEAKDEFLSMASHQLRTPLTSVKGYLSMVLEGDVGKITSTQRRLLAEAFTSSERMVHLINDFLNVSRLQTGKFMLEMKPINLAKVTEQEVDSLQTTAGAHAMKLEYHMPSHFPILYIDENKIRQVIMNFIDNAIYYSKEDSTITTSLGIEEGSVLLKVHDTGIGVPAEEQAHIFTKFFRAANARKQRPDGTGVGLFLAKKVIVAHGGSMVFESKEGEGSTFGFRLPVKKLSEAPADDADELEK